VDSEGDLNYKRVSVCFPGARDVYQTLRKHVECFPVVLPRTLCILGPVLNTITALISL
jgi:hypothetical protein